MNMNVQEKLLKDPTNPALYREVGKELVEQDRAEEAVDVFSRGLAFAPLDYEMHFWRGRKYISTERYPEAAADFQLCAAMRPDDWECWYYLGVSSYLSGLYPVAKLAHEHARELMLKNDIKAIPATCDWYWMICMKMGLKDEAQAVLDYVTPGMEAEDGDYLDRCLLYKGYYKPETFLQDRAEACKASDRPSIYDKMLRYGLANYLHYQGRDEESIPLLKGVAESTEDRFLFAVKEAMQDLDALGVEYTVPQV